MTAPAATTYLRRLTLFDATMVVIGGIIGAGIFLNPAVVAERAGTAPLILLTWIVGGVVAVAGALCFAELGARRPEAGGGYVYLREIAGPLPAFLYGWTFLLVANTGVIAALAVAFARYLADLLRISPSSVPALAIGAIVVLTAVNYRGIRTGAVTLNVLTVLKLAALAALIAIGLTGVAAVAGPAAAPAVPAPDGGAPAGAGSWWHSLRLLGVALIPVVFSYGGWHHVNNVAGEVTRPERTIPRALLLGIAAVVGLYLLVTVAYLRILGAEGLAKSLAPASDTVRAVVGPAGGTLIGLGIVISTLGCAHLSIVSAPRMLQRMAADGLFFARAAALHPRHRTPHYALVLQAAWAVVLVLSGTYGQLLDYVIFGDWLFLTMIAGTVFVYHRRDARAAAQGGAPVFQGYRVTGYPVMPALFIVMALFVVASVVVSAPRNALYGALLIAAGVPAFALWRARTRGAAGAADALAPVDHVATSSVERP